MRSGVYTNILVCVPLMLALFFLPSSIFWSRALLLIIFATLLVAASPLVKSNFSLKKDKLFWLLIGLNLASYLASFLFSADSALSLLGADPRYLGFLQEIAIFALFIIVANYRLDYQKLTKILRIYIIPIAIVVGFGLYQYFIDIPSFSKDFFQGRIDSLLGNPNSYALFLLIIAPIILFLYHSETSSNLKKFLYLPFFCLMIFSLFITGSRSAIFVALLDLLLCLGLYFPRQLPKNVLKTGTISLLILASLYLGFHSFPDRFLLKENSLISLHTRTQIWQGTIPVIAQNPIFGFGQDQFQFAFEKFSDSTLLKEPVIVDRAHNLFLDLLVERGFFGLACFLSLAIFIFYRALSHLRQKPQHSALIVALIFIGINYFVFLQLNFTDLINETYFWISCGLLYNLSKPEKN